MPRTLLSEVRAIARQAGPVILRYFGRTVPGEIVLKGDGSPVTLADRAAEAVIGPALRHLTPALPVISEEGSEPRPALPPGGRFWLVDPLDGTREFINGNPDFTVNIALIDHGVPVLGVVYVPAAGELFEGAGPGTAQLWHDERPEHGQPLRVRPAPAGGVTVMGSRSHANAEGEQAFLDQFRVAERRSRGSSLKFCELARGAADLYPRCGPTHEWDTAAGHAVLLAAGGRVDAWDGGPLTYGKPGFLNPWFVARGG